MAVLYTSCHGYPWVFGGMWVASCGEIISFWWDNTLWCLTWGLPLWQEQCVTLSGWSSPSSWLWCVRTGSVCSGSRDSSPSSSDCTELHKLKLRLDSAAVMIRNRDAKGCNKLLKIKCNFLFFLSFFFFLFTCVCSCMCSFCFQNVLSLCLWSELCKVYLFRNDSHSLEQIKLISLPHTAPHSHWQHKACRYFPAFSR